jgi:hypothetical protein
MGDDHELIARTIDAFYELISGSEHPMRDKRACFS